MSESNMDVAAIYNVADRVSDFVHEQIKQFNDERVDVPADPFWTGLSNVGTELWLDTGDMDAAAELWAGDFTALTTNNTLLNNEVQKGIYDGLVGGAAELLSDLDPQQRVLEIAFILNVLHGLRLANRFGGKVSVEMHTDISHDIGATVAYGKRAFAICPDQFIVKVPLTAGGLIATRELREAGVPINFTLGFSARHNHVAAVFAKPTYVNVFLGRLNAYVSGNELGDGVNVGEKSIWASQLTCRDVSANRSGEATLQIAASMRGGGQVESLAGMDVYTMPTKVAKEGRETLSGNFADHSTVELNPTFNAGTEGARVEVLWEVSDALSAFAAGLDADPPSTAAELIDRAHAGGVGDLFPRLSDADLAQIDSDGKIPVHSTWADRIAGGEVAIDTLLNLAGLAAFTNDQTALDDRIRGLI
jgi:transaldolase